MEEKIFELLEKLFIQQKEMEERLQGQMGVLQGQINGLEGKMGGLQGQMTRLDLKIEHQISNKIDALFEFRDMTNERLERIENKIDIINDKVDNHELRIKVLESWKKKTS